ncbi:MAG: thioredoxin family protein [Candidatus Desantisbacteria bacterium]
MLRLCICLIAMSLIGCQCSVQDTKKNGKQGSVISGQETEPQTMTTVPLSENPVSKGTKSTKSTESIKTTDESVQQKPVEITNIQWVNSFDDGLKIAKTRNCPLMVDFFADWCGWCKKLDEETWTNKDVILLAQRFVCVKIDCDTDRQTPARYGVRPLPTILFINTEATVIHQVIGYRNPEDMIVEMNKAVR